MFGYVVSQNSKKLLLYTPNKMLNEVQIVQQQQVRLDLEVGAKKDRSKKIEP
jgi:hypothetical protein